MPVSTGFEDSLRSHCPLTKSSQRLPSTSALLRAVKQWTYAPDAPPIHICQEEATLSLSIDAALSSQTSIGWVNLFHGFVSLSWGGVYGLKDPTTPDDCRQAAVVPRLAKTIIQALQNYTFALWVGWNAILHEAQSAESVYRQYYLELRNHSNVRSPSVLFRSSSHLLWPVSSGPTATDSTSKETLASSGLPGHVACIFLGSKPTVDLHVFSVC